jgi:hypothetical protein
MAAYRINASNVEDPPRPPSTRKRIPLALTITVVIHAGILAAAFMARAPEPPQTATQTVRVMRGQVDHETGELMVIGMADARVRK